MPRNSSASPPRASRDRISPARNAAGTDTSEQAAIHSSACERVPDTRSLTSSAVKNSRTTAPARLGSSARRRGPDVLHQRAAMTAMVATQEHTSSPRWTRSITCATSASGKASRRCPSSGSTFIHAIWRITSGAANEATSSRSRRDCRRPLVSSVRISATKKKIHQSTSSTRAVCARAKSSWPSSGATKNAKPVAVIRLPLRLSGRRRQATSPNAANEPPTSVKTTFSHSNGPSAGNRTGLSASASAATAAVHSTTQNPGRCRRPAKRLRSCAPLRSSDSLAGTSHGAQRTIDAPLLLETRS